MCWHVYAIGVNFIITSSLDFCFCNYIFCTPISYVLIYLVFLVSFCFYSNISFADSDGGHIPFYSSYPNSRSFLSLPLHFSPAFYYSLSFSSPLFHSLLLLSLFPSYLLHSSFLPSPLLCSIWTPCLAAVLLHVSGGLGCEAG